MKINIVGTSGSGKSSLGKQLAEKLNIPLYEMDEIFWKAGWKEPSDDEFFPKLEKIVSMDDWILDGNYTRTIPLKWKEVELVIWVDYGFGRTLFQVIRRSIKRLVSQKELWPGTGNKESLLRSFSSKSIVLWMLRNYTKNKQKYSKMMGSDRFSHIEFIRLQSPKQAQEFIEKFSCEYAKNITSVSTGSSLRSSL